MDEYSIYWLEDAVADEFFYKGGLLYQFFKNTWLKDMDQDVQKQYAYITKKFVAEHLIAHVKSFRSNNQFVEIDGHMIQIKRKNQSITLEMYQNHLQFRCCTLKDAEELLFPILRSYHSSLFVAGINVHNYGWMTPRRSVEKYESRERLYFLL